eukprot:1533022-Prymnesium_polylepis.1
MPRPARASEGPCASARPSRRTWRARARCAGRAAARGSGCGTWPPAHTARTRPRRTGPCGRGCARRPPAASRAPRSPRPGATARCSRARPADP